METKIKVLKLVLKELGEQTENKQIVELINQAKGVLGQNAESDEKVV